MTTTRPRVSRATFFVKGCDHTGRARTMRTAQEIENAIATDAIARETYGKDWERVKDAELFQHNYGYEKPVEIHGFQWSTTFWRWSALVTFSDGWHGYTWPKPKTV